MTAASSPQRAGIRLIVMPLLLLALAGALCIGTPELLLRLAWHNPNVPEIIGLDYPGYIRLQDPNGNSDYDTRGLYADTERVVFRTDANGRIVGSPRQGQPIADFYGGSTTESRYVREGSRWPDLIGTVSARNYGLSGNTTIDNYYNFKFNLLRIRPLPKEAFFMEAINDFRVRSYFLLDGYPEHWDGASNKKREEPRRRFRIYLYDFVRFAVPSLSRSYRVVDYYENRVKQAEAKLLPVMSDEEFEADGQRALEPFLAQRADAIEKIIELGRQHEVKLTFLPQPNSYRVDFKPYRGLDLRLFPDINGKRLTIKQSAKVFEMINDNTRQAALRNGAAFIDVAGYFERHPSSSLFYDQVHLTEAGSQLFAAAINEARARRNE
jgi:hypothetical protein